MTKSLSNLIKSGYVYVDHQQARVIDSDKRNDGFMSLQFPSIDQTKTHVISEYEQKYPEADNDGFASGLDVIHMEDMLEENTLLNEEKNRILEEAQEEAAQILEEAKLQATQIKEEAYEEGKKLGYEEGYLAGQSEIKQLEEELHRQMSEQQQAYEKEVASLEPKFADVLIQLLQKVTGFVADESNEVITYLISNAISEIDNNKEFVIKVSSQDYETVRSKKEEISNYISEEARLEIVEEKSMSKNQCYIETESKIFDCSLDAQMRNLILNLQLLSNSFH